MTIAEENLFCCYCGELTPRLPEEKDYEAVERPCPSCGELESLCGCPCCREVIEAMVRPEGAEA
jgi:hypothetical protein